MLQIGILATAATVLQPTLAPKKYLYTHIYTEQRWWCRARKRERWKEILNARIRMYQI